MRIRWKTYPKLDCAQVVQSNLKSKSVLHTLFHVNPNHQPLLSPPIVTNPSFITTTTLDTTLIAFGELLVHLMSRFEMYTNLYFSILCHVR